MTKLHTHYDVLSRLDGTVMLRHATQFPSLTAAVMYARKLASKPGIRKQDLVIRKITSEQYHWDDFNSIQIEESEA